MLIAVRRGRYRAGVCRRGGIDFVDHVAQSLLFHHVGTAGLDLGQVDVALRAVVKLVMDIGKNGINADTQAVIKGIKIEVRKGKLYLVPSRHLKEH